MTGIERIAAERKRQIEEEDWAAENDDRHSKGELARAAACYALPYKMRHKHKNCSCYRKLLCKLWPWSLDWWYKPTPDNRIRELEKAGALIAAEIDRLLRLEGDKRKEER